MPITKGAIRKLSADKRKAVTNLHVKTTYKAAVLAMRKKPSAKALTTAFQKLDRAAKVNIIHKNKAARLKSRLAKLLSSKKKS